MESTNAAEEARAVLEEAELGNPEAHGHNLRDMAELLRAAASFVEVRARVVRLARLVAQDDSLSDEEAVRAAGALAFKHLPRVKA